jgi:hypothetical protein
VADIETLTDEERVLVDDSPFHCERSRACEKALRIIDALTVQVKAGSGPCHALRVAAEARALELTERIERARKILDEGRTVDSAEARLAHDLREVLGG